jgi:DNA-binding IclR family transcriptional regulator
MKPLTKPVDALLGLPGRDDDTVDSQFVTALARGLEVLRAFEPKEGPLGNSELAERSGLPKPTVSRITYTLTKLGYLEYLPRLGKYRIGLGVLALGHECVGGAALRRAARPFMQDFASYADASVALGGRDRLSMVYLDVSRGLQTASFSLDVGARIPMYRSAMGFAYLWAIPDKARNFLFEAMRKRLGEEWPTVKKQITAAFKSLDRDGFCVAEGTYERAISGAGVALSLQEGTEVYAITCSAPTFQVSTERLREEIGPRLVALATSVKTELEGSTRHAD